MQAPASLREHWTAEEDKKLLGLVAKGDMTWEEIAKELPGRTAIAAKNRHHSRNKSSTAPKRFAKPFTSEQDRFIHKLGKTEMTWSERAKEFNENFDSRTKASIKQRYRRIRKANTPKEKS